MKTALVLACAILSGCAQFSNRVYCGEDGQMVFVSWYMRYGVAAKVDAPSCKP
jgi:hypothetical protein